MTIIVIDTETGGLIPGTHALLSVGLAELGPDLKPVRTKQVFIFPVAHSSESQLDPKALPYNGYTREKWEQRGALELLPAMVEIAKWLGSAREPLCHGASFDRPFIEAAERSTGVKLDLGHRWRCSHALAYGVRDGVGLQFDSASLDCLGVMCGHWEPGQRAKAHDALEDALACAAVYRWLLGIMKPDLDQPVWFFPPGHRDMSWSHAKQGWYCKGFSGTHAGPFATEKEAMAAFMELHPS